MEHGSEFDKDVLGWEDKTEPDVVGLTGSSTSWATGDVVEQKDSSGFFVNDGFADVIGVICFSTFCIWAVIDIAEEKVSLGFS